MSTKPPKAGTLRQTPLEDLKLFPGNARRGDVDLLAESLKAHGQYKPIVVNARDMTILAGNHTYQAAAALEWKKIGCFFVDVDDLEAQRINLIDNRANDVAGYDVEALVAQLQTLPDLEATGYDTAALTSLLAEMSDDPDQGERDPDEVPTTAASRVDPGDIWQMGEHFLTCGDAADSAVLGRVMGDDRAAVVWTAPPGDVDYEGKTADALKMENDQLPSSEFFGMLLAAFTAAFESTVEGGVIYACHLDTTRLISELALRKAGWSYAQTLVWVKDNFVLGRGDYQGQHEPILYGWRPGAELRCFGSFDKASVTDEEPEPRKMNKGELVELVRELRNERGTDVVREQRPTASSDHPIVKPVGLVQRHLQNSSVRGDVVLDPFAGSGTVAIAAETLGRRARLVELDPDYCDVILRRWEEFTGKKAKVRKSR